MNSPAKCIGFGVLISACGASFHDQQVEAGHQAAARGDMAAATAAWDAACRVEPSDVATCNNANKAAQELKKSSLAKAQPCDQGEIEACAAALRDIRRLRPNDQEVANRMAQGSQLFRQRCAMLERPGQLQSTLDRVECLSVKATSVGDASFNSVFAEERSRAAATFAAAGGAKSPGVSYVYFRTAQCLSRRVEAGNRVEAASNAIQQTYAVPIGIRARSTGPSSLSQETTSPCNALAKALGPRARCAEGVPAAPEFSLDMSVNLGRTAHASTSEIRIARYVSGIERTPNPERNNAEAELLRSKDGFDAIERQTHDRESACNRTRSPYDCDRYNAIVPVYNRRIAEVRNAEDRVARTPAYLEREIVEQVPYTVSHHTWTTSYSIDGRTLAGDSLHNAGTIRKQDSEHPGVVPARVDPDPLIEPSQDDTEQSVRTVLVGEAKAVIARSFTKRASCASQPWNVDAPTLECRAASELYLSGRFPEPKAWMPNIRCE